MNFKLMKWNKHFKVPTESNRIIFGRQEETQKEFYRELRTVVEEQNEETKLICVSEAGQWHMAVFNICSANSVEQVLSSTHRIQI